MTGGSYTLTLNVAEVGANTPLNGSKSQFNHSDGIRVPLSYGTGPGRMSVEVMQTKTIAAATAVTYDLSSGTDFQDIFGFPAVYVVIRSLVIWIADGGDEDGVSIGGAASDCWPASFASTTDKALIYPDSGPFCADRRAGTLVTSSAKNLKIENLSTTEAVSLAIRIAGGIDGGGYAMGVFGLTYP
jgi:hypothetical protein